MSKLWTATFERLPAEKRRRVLDAAKAAFAAEGLQGANINRIAESAGISVGALYKYFRTKEDLFLALIEESHDIIRGAIAEVLALAPDLRSRIEALLWAAVNSSRQDPERVHLYIACTTEALTPLAGELSISIEAVSAEAYRAMLATAKARGEVRADLDPAWGAYFLDNLLLLAQFSRGSFYYEERLRLFLGGAIPEDEVLVATLLDFALRGLT